MAATPITVTSMVLNTVTGDLPAAAWDLVVNGAQGFSVDTTGVGGPIVLGIFDSTGAADNVTITAGDRPPAQLEGQGNMTITMAASDVRYVTLESGRFESSTQLIAGTSAGNNTTRVAAFALPTNWG